MGETELRETAGLTFRRAFHRLLDIAEGQATDEEIEQYRLNADDATQQLLGWGEWRADLLGELVGDMRTALGAAADPDRPGSRRSSIEGEGGQPMIRVEVSSNHGVDVFDLPVVPQVGDYLRVPTSAYGEDRTPEQYEEEARVGHHGDDMAERVRYVVWSFAPDGAPVVTVDTDCVTAP